jgi:hypothetical protein
MKHLRFLLIGAMVVGVALGIVRSLLQQPPAPNHPKRRILGSRLLMDHSGMRFSTIWPLR